MHSLKAINNDLFLLIILLVRLGLEPHVHVNTHWNREPETRSVYLGSTSAYTQTSFHTPYFSDRFPHPKSLQHLEADEVSNLFSRLNFYNSLRNSPSSLIALIANSLDGNADQNSDNSGNGFADRLGDAVQGIDGVSANDREESLILDTDVELSPEDMDLIEILWKQDIDLGVSREAYDSRPCVEIEKLKELKIKQEENFNNTESEVYEEASPVPDSSAGLNYTIDSETGEYVFEDFSELDDDEFPGKEILKNDTTLLNEDLMLQNETFGPLSEESYLPFDSDAVFSEFSELFSPSLFSEMVPEDIPVESDYLSQIEDLERKLEEFESLAEPDGSNTTAGDIYTNMDECWPDTTTMLPLLALSSAHQTSIPPHPMHGYPGANSTNSLHLSTTQPNRTSDSFISMLQNGAMEVPPVAEEDFHSTSITSTIGPSSIGCAVAESIATLTNDTDPIPSGNIINAAYNSEYPELLYSNHTVAVPHNELLISDLLLDEDLHLVSLPPNGNEEKLNDDHMDTSSDSMSLPSRQLQSVSDYESERSFSDVPFDHVNCNDPQYFSLKSYYSENCAGSTSSNKISFTKKFEYSVPKSSGVGSSNFLHHNHSYHLPFSSEDPHFKTGSKIKSKSSSDDDSCNKDEKRAKELKLPITIDDIINLAIDEYNERLSKYELSEAQLTLIRDIRRRGKNKVAAQNCRKRKMDQISGLKQDLGFLQREKMQLKSKQSNLLQEKHHYEEKYALLYDLVLQTSNSKPPNPPNNIPVIRNGRISLPTNSELLTEEDTDPHRGTRTKRKYKK